MINENFKKDFADLIESVGTDWTKPWISPNIFPSNCEGKQYTGAMNALVLSWKVSKYNWETPCFGTFNYWEKNGVTIKKGAKASNVLFSTYLVKDKNGNKIDYDVYKLMPPKKKKDYKTVPIIKWWSVFNPDQTNINKNGVLWKELEKYKCEPDVNINPEFSVPAIDKIISGETKWLCPIKLSHNGKAYYSLTWNEVCVPPKQSFIDSQSYYSTLLHELTHSTKNTLKRGGDVHRWGDYEYGREELCAEITSAYLCAYIGFGKTISEHSAKYVKCWLSSIKEQPRFIDTVYADVEKAIKYFKENTEIFS